MESLSICRSASPPFLNPAKTPKNFISNYIRICSSKLISFNSLQTLSISSNETQTPILQSINSHRLFINPQFSFLFLGFAFPHSSFASETTTLPTEEVSNKINLESILVSIDEFFNRYPFFVATVVFIWLVVIPLTEEYLQKYKFISAINAFKKLQNEPDAQLLDIRDIKSVTYLGSPSLKLLSKNVVQLEFREGDEEGFVKRVLENFRDPSNTAICIIDNFDGNSMKVAELLVENGFKEAYAIRGGIRGNKGWQEIQETLLPPAVHVYPKKRTKTPKSLETNGGIIRQDENNGNTGGQRPLSPYPNYPDLKPPSSPTPSKPE